MRRELGVDYLDVNGQPRDNLKADDVVVAATDVLLSCEPRIVINRVVPHFEDARLSSITVDYREITSGTEEAVTVGYVRHS